MKRFFRSLTAFILILLLLVSAASALTVEQALNILEQSYYYSIPEQAYEAESLEALFSVLGDPYSYYMTEEDYQDFLNSVEDTVNLVGIGVSIQYTEQGILVTEPLLGSSAYEAGIQSGDIIVAIEGTSCVPGTESHRALILGEEGTEVTVTVLRDGVTRDYVLERRVIMIPNTTVTVRDGHIGYIDCNSFGSDTGLLFIEGVEAYNDSVNRWLVDLRYNSGGYSDAAVNAVGSLAGPGVYLYLRTGSGMLCGSSYSNPASSTHPVVVLVNEYSASASEAFTASIRDAGVGISVGSRTYGKGSAQIILDGTTNPDYFEDDALKVTAYRFYSKDGVTNDKIGVIPDLVVEAEMAEAVAMALCGSGRLDIEDHLLVELGSWVYAIDLRVTPLEVIAALLEALPPSTALWLYEQDMTVDYTVEEVAQRLGITYESRWLEDVGESLFEEFINILATYGLISGDESGNFNPAGTLTRGEACAMVAKALGIKDSGESYFTDVSADDPYAGSINGLAAAGLVKGMGDGTFCPQQLMSRQEYCVLLERVLRNLNYNYQYLDAHVTADDLVLAEKMGFHSWARMSAVVLGNADALFFSDYVVKPAEAVLREEAAAILYGVLMSTGVLK